MDHFGLKYFRRQGKNLVLGQGTGPGSENPTEFHLQPSQLNPWPWDKTIIFLDQVMINPNPKRARR
jgi:hypothetical protein